MDGMSSFYHKKSTQKSVVISNYAFLAKLRIYISTEDLGKGRQWIQILSLQHGTAFVAFIILKNGSYPHNRDREETPS
jgi:hypothetical protein